MLMQKNPKWEKTTGVCGLRKQVNQLREGYNNKLTGDDLELYIFANHWLQQIQFSLSLSLSLHTLHSFLPQLYLYTYNFRDYLQMQPHSTNRDIFTNMFIFWFTLDSARYLPDPFSLVPIRRDQLPNTWIYLIENKTDVFDYFQNMKILMERGNKEEDQASMVKWRKRIIFRPVQLLSAAYGNPTQIHLQISAGAKRRSQEKEPVIHESGMGNARREEHD